MGNIEELLKPIDESMPCGPNLEEDPEFLALERDIRGEPEREMGNTFIPAKEPNWKEIKLRAKALLLRSKDLNAAIWFARASTHCDGIGGLLTGLNLIHGCLTQFWDCVHPCLDPKEHNDPERRINILSQIENYEIFVRDVHSIKLTFKRAELTVRDILVIQGKLTVSKVQPEYTQAQVEGIFHDPENAAIIQGWHQQLEEALGLLKDLKKTLVEKLDDIGSLPNFDKLGIVLISIQRLCAESASSDEEGIEKLSTDPMSSVAAASASGGSTASGEIRSREDIVRVLEKVCRYIERTEPTNPAALVIRFAQTLMTKNFVEIMELLPPEDIKIFKKVLDTKSKK